MKRLSLKKAKAWLEENRACATIMADINNGVQLVFKNGEGNQLSAPFVASGFSWIRYDVENILLNVLKSILIREFSEFIKKTNSTSVLRFFNANKGSSGAQQKKYSPQCIVTLKPQCLQDLVDLLNGWGFDLKMVYDGIYDTDKSAVQTVWVICPLI